MLLMGCSGLNALTFFVVALFHISPRSWPIKVAHMFAQFIWSSTWSNKKWTKKLKIQFARAARWKKRMFPRWFLCPVSNNSSRAATCCKWHIKNSNSLLVGFERLKTPTQKKRHKVSVFFLFPAKRKPIRCSAWTAFVLIIGLWRALVLPAWAPRSTGSSN